MKPKSVRYNIICFSLVALCAAHIGVGFFVPTILQGANSSQDSQITDSVTPNVDSDITDSPSTSESQQLPTDPIELINYALDIYNNGKGSLSRFNFIVQNSGVLPKEYGGFGAHVTQYATGRIARTPTQNLEESYFYYGGIGDSTIEGLLVSNDLVKFGYRAINVDLARDSIDCVETPEININTNEANCSNWSYNLGSKTTRSAYNVANGKNRFKVIYSMEFPLVISYDTVEITDINIRKDPQYKYITVSYKLDKLPEMLNDYYMANSALRTVSYSSYTMEFKISKKTGRLSQYVRREAFKSYGLKGKLEISSNATFTQTFETMDKPTIVNKVYEKLNKN